MLHNMLDATFSSKKALVSFHSGANYPFNQAGSLTERNTDPAINMNLVDPLLSSQQHLNSMLDAAFSSKRALVSFHSGAKYLLTILNQADSLTKQYIDPATKMNLVDP
ncbi:hypothetical protein ERO13_D07G069533v2 [Gossypium hirsutum]|uniref:Uncharacterized protein n=4 Tax=Gossypium TaxID=3633 RepID=A0A5J5QN38_GOSBA|nr:hypothetical protein ES319_D07G072700v1 [Gossypium barbadense]KAG4137401.1 hypothetical protein ERO13_D07G069533v2 [Gossypium hirsutum]TYG60533.1 hypothetical protein ES288_D07G076100v1 [Gossypium darwinii]TYH61788.1 hypothetical protein ES332_D07G076200v1 [Gossypium tomentosum]TYI72640.1 hypothetical protein E1A91_D07G075000v1 [Gossypium mustelinum]